MCWEAHVSCAVYLADRACSVSLHACHTAQAPGVSRAPHASTPAWLAGQPVRARQHHAVWQHRALWRTPGVDVRDRAIDLVVWADRHPARVAVWPMHVGMPLGPGRLHSARRRCKPGSLPAPAAGCSPGRSCCAPSWHVAWGKLQTGLSTLQPARPWQRQTWDVQCPRSQAVSCCACWHNARRACGLHHVTVSLSTHLHQGRACMLRLRSSA